MRLDTAPRRCRVFGAVSCEIVSIMVPPDNYLPGNGARRGRGAALDATGHQGRRVESAGTASPSGSAEQSAAAAAPQARAAISWIGLDGSWCRWVVSLQRAGKYQRPAWRPSQGPKGLDERGSTASQWPSDPW